jgi:hypothetical protein
MSLPFIKDLFKKIANSKEDKPLKTKTITAAQLSEDLQELKDFKLFLSLASFTDQGMNLQALSEASKKKFPKSLLDFIANYSAIFVQQSEGEHLFGPLPLPKSKGFTDASGNEIIFDDWYMLIYIFSSKDETVEDDRIIALGSLVASMFIIIYPRKFESFITQTKNRLKEKISKKIGIAQEIQEFSDKVVTQFENELIEEIIQNSQQIILEEDATSQLEKKLEYQLLVINEKIEAIYNLANASYRFIEYQEKANLAVILVHNEYGLITSLQYHIPPFKDLRDVKWRVFHSGSEIVKLIVGKMIFWFVSPDKFQEFAQETNFERIETVGIYLSKEALNQWKKIPLMETISQNQKPELSSIIVSNKRSKELEKYIIDKQKKLKNKATINYEELPNAATDTIISELSAFYDKIIALLTDYNITKQSKSGKKGEMLDKKGREDLSKILQKTLGEKE